MRYLSPAPTAPAPTETAVIAAIPEAEHMVGDFRQQFDEAAGWGVPAHVTVLYPFVDPTLVDQQVLSDLGAAVQSVHAFECRFARTGWFGEDVLWLDPEPDTPFRQLAAALWAAFPDCPPYGGAFADVVPHLTVAEKRMGDLPALQAAERAVHEGLPICTRVESLLLIAGTSAANSWRILHGLPLASTTG
jgi:2'-5' RNA ligase